MMRFCLDCDSLLNKIFVNGNDTARFPLDEEKQKIAEYIYKEYKELRSNVGDLELDLLNSVKVDTASGRFDIVVLALGKAFAKGGPPTNLISMSSIKIL